MSTYKLRPHHGLCIHFFRGQGYSQAFVDNMTEIVQTLEKNPTIQLVAGADSLCAPCPNRVGEGGCASGGKADQYDAAVASLCALTLGEYLPWLEFSQRVEAHILSQGLRTQVCGNCQWSELCQ